MRIAFTHNLQRAMTEEEAEFDTPDTVRAIAMTLRSLGHTVDTIDVACPTAELVTRLESFRPDIIFNTAEGRTGRFREAFYPALFDELGMPYTGSDAYVCVLTLDKHLTKMLVAAHGVRVARGHLVGSDAFVPEDFPLPAIVKPNFEGSSKGIDDGAVVHTRSELRTRVEALLTRYPDGLLVEEFVPGKDVVVPFIEGIGTKQDGVLPAAEYLFDDPELGTRSFEIYGYRLKHLLSEAVTVRAPARLEPSIALQLHRAAKKVFDVLGVRDLGRADFRVTPTGEVVFIEVNALPSLEPGAGLYVSAASVGCVDVSSVLNAVIRSAVRRRGLPLEPAPTMRRRPRRPVRVGLTYNLKRVRAKSADDDDSEAEFDSAETIEALSEAIGTYGHEVVPIEARPDMLSRLREAELDIVFNIAEGVRGRGREALVPALLELLDIEYTGSDPTTLAVTLDKALAKQIVGQAGVETPRFTLLNSGTERLPRWLTYPAIVKPVAEGSSKGVGTSSVAHSEAELRESAKAIIQRYRQAALVEEFVGGREFTVGVLGDRQRRVLPPMEVIFASDAPHQVYSFAHKLAGTSDVRYQAPATLDPSLQRRLERSARKAFAALGCRDVARIDFRLDATGRVHFLECNPLPGMTPGWSDLCIIAEGAGMDYRALVGAILSPALRRWRAAAKPK